LKQTLLFNTVHFVNIVQTCYPQHQACEVCETGECIWGWHHTWPVCWTEEPDCQGTGEGTEARS